MDFEQQKQKQLSKKDKSNIGRWDDRIKGLCRKINKKRGYYTTSSCSGRIVLIKSLDKKSRNIFLFRSHKKISFQELKKALKKIKYDGLVEFKMSPCILHVACLSLNDAQELVDKAKFAGWKRSGIISVKRNIVELLSTESLEFPIMNKKNVFVSDDFLRLIVKIANSKLERTWKKVKRLEGLL